MRVRTLTDSPVARYFLPDYLLGVMTADLRKLAHAVPFVPFTIHLADEGQLRVPTVDHIAVPPAGGRIFVFGDDEKYDVISSLLVSRVTVDKAPVPSSH